MKGGALVGVPPNLTFYQDTQGKGTANEKTVVATDFGSPSGQPEHMANTPMLAMDNWIYGAAYPMRLKATGTTWQHGPGLGRGQWGLCQDNVGRLFYNYNSDLLRTDLLPTIAYSRNPLLRGALGINHQVINNQTVYPSHPTPGVNRGYEPKSLRPDGTLASTTATCGAVIYRGAAYAPEYQGNAFIPEPAGNLVKRLVIEEKEGVLHAVDTAKGLDFLTSTDERFRPVQLVNGPDGCIYIVDMYRGIIQHTAFITHYLVENIKERKLEQPYNLGRIWRLVPDSVKNPAKVVLPSNTVERVKMLTHADGWVRDTAQRLLVESADTTAVKPLQDLVQHHPQALTRLHALWTLEGLNALTPEILRTALHDSDAQVKAAAVRILPNELTTELAGLIHETDTVVLSHLAIRLSAANQPATDEILANLLSEHGQNALIREGAFTGLRGREHTMAKTIAQHFNAKNATASDSALEGLAALVSQAGKAAPFDDMLQVAAGLNNSPDAQAAILRGLALGSSDPKAKKAKVVKTLWFSQAPAAMATLESALTKSSSATAKSLKLIDERIAWPGKPGAPTPPKVVPLTAAQKELYEKGHTTFLGLCAACHQPHGFGLDGLAPPLVDSEWVLGKPESLVRIVSHGLGGPIKVGGRTWDLAMPPCPQLSDEEVAGVLTYIRREWEHTASAVDAKLVHDVRAQEAGRTNSWTAEELRPTAKPAPQK
jgi:putative membrane-bound dehydrogenase-like protein